MPTGMILLLLVAALVYFGVAQRILDRMRLTDGQALLFIGLMIAGSFIDIPLYRGIPEVSINVGGALVPIALCVYLLIGAETTRERVRGLVAAGVTAGIVYGLSQLTIYRGPLGGGMLDPLWFFSIIAGIIGYLAGRSRRSAFIAGILGVVFTDIIYMFRAYITDMPSTVAIGGAGVFDSVVVAGFIAVGLAELVGETRERLQGGPAAEEDEEEVYVKQVSKLEAEETGPAQQQLSEAEKDLYLQGIHGKDTDNEEETE